MTDIQNAEPPKETRSGKRKWVKAVFALSLTMNLLVIGLVAGARFGEWREHGFDPRGPERGMIRELGFGPLAAALPPKDRRAIGNAFRKEHGNFRDNRAAFKRDLDTMFAILQTEPFDAAALASVMQGQRQRVFEIGETLQRLVIERISLMSPEERSRLADDLKRRIHNGDRRGDGPERGRRD